MANQDIAISVKGLSKSFRRYGRPIDRLKELLLPGRSYADDFWALRDIDLEVYRGQTLGIVGQNGSGKSTLLQVIARTLMPTQGTVRVSGRVAALLELGSGFNPEFTGRQNVFFNAQILGLRREEIEARFDQIAAFASIGHFIDEPVKTYSSGMYVRLAFAVAIHVDPEVLIVDEALAVGDGVFVHRCMAKIKEFQDAGGTILFVSHDVGAVSRLCSEAAWIKQGQLVDRGKPTEVCKHYQAWIHEEVNRQYQQAEGRSPEIGGAASGSGAGLGPRGEAAAKLDIVALTRRSRNPFTHKPFLGLQDQERFGSGRGEVRNVQVLDAQGKPLRLAEPGQTITVMVTVVRHGEIAHPNVGIALLDRLRTTLSGWSTDLVEPDFAQRWQATAPEGEATVEISFVWPYLALGTYSLDIAFGNGPHSNLEMLDWIQNAAVIEAITPEAVYGTFQLAARQVRLRPHGPAVQRERGKAAI